MQFGCSTVKYGKHTDWNDNLSRDEASKLKRALPRIADIIGLGLWWDSQSMLPVVGGVWKWKVCASDESATVLRQVDVYMARR